MSDNIIKNVYSQYFPSDYNYGDISATNLNPKREINFDKIEVIRKRLQEVTDDIVRRKIEKPPEPEEKIRTSSSSSLPSENSMLRQAAQLNTGGVGMPFLFNISTPENSIGRLIEPIIGTFPEAMLLEELDGPLSLECEEILKKFDFSDEEEKPVDDGSDPNGLDNEIREDTGTGVGEGAGGDDGAGEDEEEPDEFKECALIELNWLKIILIILRIIKILQILMDLILAIIVPILEIVMLALQCWLIPPSAEQLRQRITEMIIALIIMIITRLIQMIWNLLNLDCLCDQTMDIIRQIREAMAAFSSLMSIFNINSVKMMYKNVQTEVKDSLEEIAKSISDRKEEWKKLFEGDSNWGDVASGDFWKKSLDEIKNGTVEAVMNNPNVNKGMQTAKAVQDLTSDAMNFMKDDINKIIQDMINQKKETLEEKDLPQEAGSDSEESLMKAIGDVTPE